MKLLLDENLSPRLIELLSEVYPGTDHVDRLKLGSARDEAIWEHAKAHGFTIVSKDSDLADMSVLRGAPPKVIWVRLGNCSTASVEFLLKNSVGAVERFLDSAETYLVLGRR